MLGFKCTLSLPVWEEWIEIDMFAGLAMTRFGLFPYGKSGLKYRPNA